MIFVSTVDSHMNANIMKYMIPDPILLTNYLELKPFSSK